jgi:uncharacterized protein
MDAGNDLTRVVATAVGPVMFFQSGGCCDGSLPMCFRDGEFVIGDRDLLLGTLDGCAFYIDARQFEAWKTSQLTLDVEAGLPEGFSLPAGDDGHFVTRTKVCSAAVAAELTRPRSAIGADAERSARP